MNECNDGCVNDGGDGCCSGGIKPHDHLSSLQWMNDFSKSENTYNYSKKFWETKMNECNKPLMASLNECFQ